MSESSSKWLYADRPSFYRIVSYQIHHQYCPRRYQQRKGHLRNYRPLSQTTKRLLPLCTQIKTRICVVLSDSSCQEDTPWTKLSFKTAWLIPPTLFFAILHQRIHPALIAIYNTILIGWPTQNPLIDGEYRKGLFMILITFRMFYHLSSQTTSAKDILFLLVCYAKFFGQWCTRYYVFYGQINKL